MPATQLYFTASVEDQWRALVGPWLRKQAGIAWKNQKPTVVLTPSRAEGFYLRSRLLEEKIPLFGIRFWTPSDARNFLLANILPELGAATQAELRFLARACAEKLSASKSADSATVGSVIREPGAFLRAYDLLLGAGWNPAREGVAYGRDLAGEMQRALKKSGIETQAGVHRDLLGAISGRKETVLANLLVVGFNATHWPLWDLLKASVFAAEDSTVALGAPRTFGQDIDQLWTSSWEEVTHAEAVHPPDETSPGKDGSPSDSLVASYERGALLPDGGTESMALAFLVTPDLNSQVRAVVLQVLAYLKDESCTRLGIVFAEANALALGVADELRRLGVPIDDGAGAFMPGPFERRCWKSWVTLQEEPGVSQLIAWVRACEAEGVACGKQETLSARELANVIESVLGETLVDDLDFIARHLDESSHDRRAKPVAEFLRKRIVLPEEGTFAGYLEQTRRAVALPGWDEISERLQVEPPTWLLKNRQQISRRTFLEWLKESTKSQTRTRGADGNHFYGKVHLIIYAQMTGQTWSHLILTGLNEGVWPRIHETGAFRSRHEFMELNQQARALNRRGEGQGGQGMGHETVLAGHGHCLLPLEQQDLALRDLCAALESTSVATCLTAMTTEGGRSLLPSDFFNHAYQFKTGRMLDEPTFRKLARATEEWCGEHDSIFEQESSGIAADLTATQAAYAARRDESRSFGPYEFSYASPPANPVQLSCKEWEQAWNHPASVWLEEIVGAAPWTEGTLSWPRAIGTWVHRWLATAIREYHEGKSANEFPILLWAAADREAQAIRNRARAAGLDLYPWWEPVWGHARSIALRLSESLAPHLPGYQSLCEYRLPAELKVALRENDPPDFLLRGRLDLLLFAPGLVPYDVAKGDFSGCACWIVDFKTGAAKKLNDKIIAQGTGLQPLLYAIAIRARGAASTSISLHTFDAPLKPQVRLNDLQSLSPLLSSLDKLHREGVFGMRPDAENDYGFAPGYPIATRFVPAAVLEAKWNLVHGGDEEQAE